jgi:hypothetical protein
MTICESRRDSPTCKLPSLNSIAFNRESQATANAETVDCGSLNQHSGVTREVLGVLFLAECTGMRHCRLR